MGMKFKNAYTKIAIILCNEPAQLSDLTPSDAYMEYDEKLNILLKRFLSDGFF